MDFLNAQNTFSLLLIAIITISIAALKYSKEVRSFLAWLKSSVVSSDGKKQPKVSELLAEIKEYKVMIEDLEGRLNEIEKYLSEHRLLFDNLATITTHKAKVYIDGCGLVLRFSDTLRVQAADELTNYVSRAEEFVRALPFSDRRLTLDLSECRYINTAGISAISDIFLRVSNINGIRLKVLLSQTHPPDKLKKVLKSIEDSSPTHSAIVLEVGAPK